MILKNKTVFITGVGNGIGLAILEKVIADGGYVYALTRTKKDVKLFQNKNIKIFFGDASNTNLVKKILNQSIKDKNPINDITLEEIEKEDCIFPLISPVDWKKEI